MNIERWIEFAESGNQQKLGLLDGSLLVGWVMEVTETGLVFTTGEDRSAKDYLLSFADIDLQQLRYFDTHSQTWLPFDF